jgi:uncharacterized Fe-S cluster protein YjdI
METIKEYSNGEVTIVWKPELCIHSAICAKGLPHVFQPRDKPWIKQHADSTENLIARVNKCPSGALSFYINKEKIQHD